LQKEQMEKSRFLHYVQKNGSSMPPLPSNSAPATSAASKYEITVEGIRFQITKQGSKLVRAPGKLALVPIPSISSTYLATADDNNPPSATPRVTTIGGVKFYRTKNGNLVRHGIAKAQRYVPRPKESAFLTTTTSRLAGGIKKVNIPCKTFSWTGIVFSNYDSSQKSPEPFGLVW
jgi:hypothetical protein